jgi:hypothetical protein
MRGGVLMRALFVLYLTLIAVGLAYFASIALLNR